MVPAGQRVGVDFDADAVRVGQPPRRQDVLGEAVGDDPDNLESLLDKGVAQGRFGITREQIAERADLLLALLDGLSTRVVLNQRGTDRAAALAAARAAADRLIVTGDAQG